MIEQDVQSIVLDLRNNPGGSLDTTINVASEFLSDDLVLYLVHGNGDRHDFEADEGGLALDIPLVVLVNERSASGSEVLSAALQDRDRAMLIGTTTFGKGSANLAKSPQRRLRLVLHHRSLVLSQRAADRGRRPGPGHCRI